MPGEGWGVDDDCNAVHGRCRRHVPQRPLPSRPCRAVRADARGVYIPSDAPASDWDLVEAAARRPDAPICLVSALAHHDLTDTIPDRLDVAIPRGARPPVTDAAIAWHRFDRSTFDVGRGTVSVGGTDTEIGLYSPERCIADAFRLRGLIGYETARDVLKEWLRRGGRPTSLIEVAALLPRTRTPILHALEVLS